MSDEYSPADLQRPSSWTLGWVDAFECAGEAGNPFPLEEPDHYAWEDGYQAGLHNRLPAGRLPQPGYLFRDDNGEYWFYDPQSYTLRHLGDEDTGTEGGYGGIFSLGEAVEDLVDGGYFSETPRRLPFDEFWTLGDGS